MATQSNNVKATISGHMNPMSKGKKGMIGNKNQIKSVKWPNYVIHEGNVIYASLKDPHYAVYLLPSGQMNRRLVLSRTTYLNHLRYGNKNDHTWEGINKGYPHTPISPAKNTYKYSTQDNQPTKPGIRIGNLAAI